MAREQSILRYVREAGNGLVVEVRESRAASGDCATTLALARHCAERGNRFVSSASSSEDLRARNKTLTDEQLPPCVRLLKGGSELSLMGEISFLYITGCDSAQVALNHFMLASLKSDAIVVVDDCRPTRGLPSGMGSEIVTFLQGNACPFELKETSSGEIQLVYRGSQPGGKVFDNEQLEELTRSALFEAVVATPSTIPDTFQGRGIVICAGGKRYFTNAWVCANILRMLGTTLPIQFWYLGEREMTPEMKDLVRPLSVECVNALEHPASFQMRILNGWESKPFALLHCPFREVIYIDADNVAVRNPEFLFETREYQETGAVFWPDFSRLSPDRSIWKICGVPFRDEPEFESGQMVIDKQRCWKALQLTMHINEYSDFYYRHIHGDKETFHMAWRKLNQPYSMPSRPINHLSACTMVQHDFEGNALFQHRNMRKWTLDGPNLPVDGFVYEPECLKLLEELREKWTEYREPTTPQGQAARAKLSGKTVLYVRVGHDYRELELLPDGRIGKGVAGMERYWRIVDGQGAVVLQINGDQTTTCSLIEDESGTWVGRWELYERMPIHLFVMSRCCG